MDGGRAQGAHAAVLLRQGGVISRGFIVRLLSPSAACKPHRVDGAAPLAISTAARHLLCPESLNELVEDAAVFAF